MRLLFNIIFVIVSVFLCTLIVSLIPINAIGVSVVKEAANNGINFVAKNNWTLRIIGLKGMTNKFEYSINVGKNKINGHGENFVYGLFSGNIYSEKISLDVHLSNDTTLVDIVNFLKSEIAKKYYSIEIKNLIINVYSNGRNSDEVIINDIKITKQKDFEFYTMNIGINQDRKNNILVTVKHPNTEKYEMNVKMEDDNCLCYVFDSRDGGNVNCLLQNVLTSVQNLREREINNKFYKTLLDKRISLKANIIHKSVNKKDVFEINGKLMVNRDMGNISFNSESNLLNIEFDNLDLDKTTFDVKNMFQNDFEKEQNLQAIAMSGSENRILLNSKEKKDFESINAFSKIVLYLIEYTKYIKLHTQFDIKKANINTVPVENLIIDVSKNVNGKININEISANFGENLDNSILIKSSNNHIGNLFVNGKKDINSFFKLLNTKIFNQNLNIDNFRMNGNLVFSTTSILLNDILFYINEVKIFKYDLRSLYDYGYNNFESDEKIFIQNIDLNRYFNFKEFYKDIYNDFIDFQQQERQDAIFWKQLFEKRNREVNFNAKKALFLNNLLFYDKKINYFAIEYNDNNKKTNIDIVADSEIVRGKVNFGLANINDKETFDLNIDVKNLDFRFDKKLYEDLRLASNRSLSEIFYEDKDYNIPSLVGLNGNLNVNIEQLFIKNNILNNINGNILLYNGIVKTEGLKLKYNNSDVETNVVMSLQGRPELQFALSGSGFLIKNIVNSPIDGYVSFQCNLKTFGFNPVKFLHDLNGEGRFIVQNITIPHFDLLGMSSEVITNGLRSDYDYKTAIKSSSLAFPKGDGNFLIEDGILKGDLTLSRELVSGSVIFEYGIFTNILRKMSGSFATMMSRKRLSTPFPIYIPFACNGEPKKPECLINWEQLDETIANIYQSV